MKAQGVQTSIHYPPVHRFHIYRQTGNTRRRDALKLTEEAAAREVTLPLYPGMTEDQVEWTARAARDALKKMK